MQLTARRHSRSPSAPMPGRGWVLASRAVGVYFAAGAGFNALAVLPRAREALSGFRDDAWLPPYRLVVGVLVPVAPAVIAGVAGFEGIVAYHLLRGRRVNGALRWAQGWVLGLVPVLAWPYWVPNAASVVAFEVVRRKITGAGPSGSRRRPPARGAWTSAGPPRRRHRGVWW
jgi:hypothetical protein